MRNVGRHRFYKFLVSIAAFAGCSISHVQNAGAYQQALSTESSDQFTNFIYDDFGSALYERNRDSETLVEFNSDRFASAVKYRRGPDTVIFSEPGKHGFQRVQVISVGIDRTTEKMFLRTGSIYRLVELRQLKELRRNLSNEEAFVLDDKPVCSPKGSAGLQQIGEQTSANMIRSMCEANFIGPGCPGKTAEVASAFAEITDRSKPGYFTCFRAIPSYGSSYAALLASLTAPTSSLKISCSDSQKSSYSNSEVSLGKDAFAEPKPQALRRALFHELNHSLSIDEEAEIAAISACCEGSKPNPSRCDDLNAFMAAVRNLRDTFKASNEIVEQVLRFSTDPKKRKEFVAAFRALQDKNKKSDSHHICAMYGLRQEVCDEAFPQAQSVIKSPISNPAQRDRIPESEPAPVVPRQVTFRPGNPTVPASFRPVMAQYQSAAQVFAREARRFDSIDTSLIPSAQAQPTRSSPRKTSSAVAAAPRVKPVELRARLEQVGTNETLLTMESENGERSAPFSFSIPFSAKEFKTAEYRAASSGAGSERAGAERVAPLAGRGAGKASDQDGSPAGAAAATGGGGSSASASLSSSSSGSGGRGLATDGPSAVRENPWLERINSPSDVRAAFKTASGDELVRDANFVAALYDKKFRVIYKCRAHGPGSPVSIINVDPSGACPSAARGE